jgi:hypothetical protein
LVVGNLEHAIVLLTYVLVALASRQQARKTSRSRCQLTSLPIRSA